MFANWSMIEIYTYLEVLFGSLTLGLIVNKVGFEIVQELFNQIKRTMIENNK